MNFRGTPRPLAKLNVTAVNVVQQIDVDLLKLRVAAFANRVARVLRPSKTKDQVQAQHVRRIAYSSSGIVTIGAGGGIIRRSVESETSWTAGA